MKPRCTAEEFFGKAKRNNQSIDSNRPDTCCFGVNIFFAEQCSARFIDVLANGQQSDVQEYLNSFHDFSGYAIGFCCSSFK